MQVIKFPPRAPEFLTSVSLFANDGKLDVRVDDMPPHVIERTGKEVPDRLRIIASWLRQAADMTLLQAHALDESANDAG